MRIKEGHENDVLLTMCKNAFLFILLESRYKNNLILFNMQEKRNYSLDILGQGNLFDID